MIEAVNTFLVKYKEQGHVHPLIQQADLQITLQSENQAIQLAIKNGVILIMQNSPEQQPKYQIIGDHKAMEQLIEGTERLRVLERQGHLEIAAPLRATLLLESLFYLTKAQENFAKVI